MANVRIACAGAWHSHAKDFANRIESIPIPNCELVAVYDKDPEVAAQWAKEKNVRCFTDYDALVNDPDIDGIIVTCPTVDHADLLIRALKAGKNAYVEKALCATVEQAKAIQAAVHEAEEKFHTRFVMSDPVERGAVLYAKQLIDEGRFGHILSVRSRNGHDLAYRNPDEVRCYQTPEESGGGVLLDMGHHSVHVLQFLLGKPVTATGMFSTVSDYSAQTGAEDYCIASYQYANGTIGIAEGGLVTPRYVGAFEVVGTEGYLTAIAGGGVRCCFNNGEQYELGPDQLPATWPKAQGYWVDCIHKNIPCDKYGIDDAVEIMEMVEAAYKSKGTLVKL